jgi:uncharacterized membrane protein YfcA
MQLLGAFGAGLVVSLVTTPAGVSGAVLLLPIQVSLLGVPNPAVTPTNLIFNLFATPSGVLRYRRLRRGVPRSPLATHLLVGTVPGVIIGAVVRVEWLSDPRAFYVVAGVVLGALGLLLLTRPAPPRSQRLQVVFVSPIALIVGVIGGIYGIGGGSFLAPILLIGGYSMFEVAPAALVSTMAASSVGVATFFVLGMSASSTQTTPDWGVGIAAGIGGIIGAYLGASAQSYVPEGALRRLLGCLALLIAVRYVYLGSAG